MVIGQLNTVRCVPRVTFVGFVREVIKHDVAREEVALVDKVLDGLAVVLSVRATHQDAEAHGVGKLLPSFEVAAQNHVVWNGRNVVQLGFSFVHLHQEVGIDIFAVIPLRHRIGCTLQSFGIRSLVHLVHQNLISISIQDRSYEIVAPSFIGFGLCLDIFQIFQCTGIQIRIVGAEHINRKTIFADVLILRSIRSLLEILAEETGIVEHIATYTSGDISLGRRQQQVVRYRPRVVGVVVDVKIITTPHQGSSQ